jgi:hypothetical protein
MFFVGVAQTLRIQEKDVCMYVCMYTCRFHRIFVEQYFNYDGPS